MDQKPPETESVDSQEPEVFDPRHHFAVPGPRVDMAAVKPHTCMQNLKQLGSWVHCYDGNHGFRLAHDEMLVQDAAGNFTISKLKVVKTNHKGKVVS